MIYFRSCPRCHGDLRDDSDWSGASRRCFQCGHVQYLTQAPTMPRTWDRLFDEAKQLPMVRA